MQRNCYKGDCAQAADADAWQRLQDQAARRAAMSLDSLY
jgi:hypothetical protein